MRKMEACRRDDAIVTDAVQLPLMPWPSFPAIARARRASTKPTPVCVADRRGAGVSAGREDVDQDYGPCDRSDC